MYIHHHGSIKGYSYFLILSLNTIYWHSLVEEKTLIKSKLLLLLIIKIENSNNINSIPILYDK